MPRCSSHASRAAPGRARSARGPAPSCSSFRRSGHGPLPRPKGAPERADGLGVTTPHRPVSPPPRPPIVIHRERTARALLLLSAIATGCVERQMTKIEKHHIGQLPVHLIRGMLEFADDGKTYAVIVKDSVGQQVVVGGRAEPSHEGCTLMQFAPGSRQL